MQPSLIHKIPRIPQWLYGRFRWGLVHRAQQRCLRYRSYDYTQLFAIIATLTGATPEECRLHYAELRSNRVFEEIEGLLRQVPDLKAEHADIKHLGIEKFVRLDRTVLYCITRLLKPDVFIETGTRWGLGSYFVARAMEENGRGQLYTFDLGIECSRTEYGWPNSQSKIGFLIPKRLEKYVTLVLGDALETLPATLSRIPPVDVYYFDSKQTFDHMLQEYALVFPHMRAGGLFMSEDTDKNAAWATFIQGKTFKAEGKYCSHFGLTTEREVSGIRL
jgi:hypothetical protein